MPGCEIYTRRKGCAGSFRWMIDGRKGWGLLLSKILCVDGCTTSQYRPKPSIVLDPFRTSIGPLAPSLQWPHRSHFSQPTHIQTPWSIRLFCPIWPTMTQHYCTTWRERIAYFTEGGGITGPRKAPARRHQPPLRVSPRCALWMLHVGCVCDGWHPSCARGIQWPLLYKFHDASPLCTRPASACTHSRLCSGHSLPHRAPPCPPAQRYAGTMRRWGVETKEWKGTSTRTSYGAACG